MSRSTRKEDWVLKVREVKKDQARWLAFLHRSLCKYFPPDIVVQASREAFRRSGHWMARENAEETSLASWVEASKTRGCSPVFESEFILGNGTCEKRMNFCPLLEAWKEMGCTKKEIDLFCDIFTEEGRGRAEKSGIALEVASRMGRGEDSCRLLLKKR